MINYAHTAPSHKKITKLKRQAATPQHTMIMGHYRKIQGVPQKNTHDEGSSKQQRPRKQE